MPIAAGVYAVPAAEKAGVRYALALSFQSRGAATTVADEAGDAYARWFEAETGSGELCETLQDVMRVVDGAFADLAAWDALPTTDRWDVAVRALAEIHRFQALEAWAREPIGPPPPVDRFHHLRPDVLALAAESLDAGRPAEVRNVLLPAVLGPDWKPAWQRYADAPGRIAVAGQLLGTLSPLDPAGVARALEGAALDLPDGLHRDVRARLSAALDAAMGVAALALGGAAPAGVPRRFPRLVLGLGRRECRQDPLAGGPSPIPRRRGRRDDVLGPEAIPRRAGRREGHPPGAAAVGVRLRGPDPGDARCGRPGRPATTGRVR